MRPFPTDLYIPIFFLYFAAACTFQGGENLQEKSKIDLESYYSYWFMHQITANEGPSSIFRSFPGYKWYLKMYIVVEGNRE